MAAGKFVGPEFEPRGVAITATFTVDQVDLILKGLQSLPIGEAGEFFFGLKNHAEQTIVAARAAHESLHTQAPPALDGPKPVTPEQEA